MNRISPYPGLRPFSEEEAIFFRGRENHVSQIIQSLEDNHFVMITGASGDGKSSIVYAGLVPKAKAGFFKAKFNNWKIHTFRPEKSPFQNMCKQISEALKMDIKYVQKELSYGFSSLIKLYQESELYIDEEIKEFSVLSAKERVEKRRKSANLLLIVDQFEEFFTNSENLTNGNPNDNSHLVANLLSHTVRLAKENNIPIYIVFTMRSDYIGNCASLRGIPELIGYSQYFIPRLNRTEIADVIRSPAELNGDKIHNRLVDHLINSTTEGADQLPIIQHCMNRLWRSANGKDLDLYHLAMCQGLKASDLPSNQQELFKENPSKPYEDEISLNNVINAHASSLFEESLEFFLGKHKEFDEKNLKLNLIFIFKCLAKMDNGKGVRYKVKFGELLNNLSYPMDIIQLNDLIYLFRKEGNDLLAPYTNQIENLSVDDPLEISHESLIRNWISLKTWSELDAQDYQTFKDLRAQSDKWIDNNRSINYLLGIGPLDYFETWFKKTNPTIFWIMKYDQFKVDDKSFFETKSKILENINDFLKESRKAIETAQIKEKRRRRIIFIAASLAIIVLSSITIWAFSEKSLADSAKEVSEVQKKNAELATKEAQKSEARALYMSARSDSLLEISEESEKLANKAKAEALKQKSFAEASNRLAQEKAKIAKEESEKTLRAIDQLLEQKNLTESQRDSANLARKEAYNLTLSAISKSLALQAANINTKPVLSGLFTYHSFEFNNRVSGNEDSPLIYTASKVALDKLKGKNYNLIDNLNFMANDLVVDDKNKFIYAIDNEGFLDKWDFKNGFFDLPKHVETVKLISSLKNPAFDVFYLGNKSFSFVDSKGNLSYINDIDNAEKVKHITNHESLIRHVVKNDNSLISVDLNGKIVVQDLNGKLISGYLSDEEIFDIKFFKNNVLFITKNKCYIADFKSQKIVHEIHLNGFLRKCLVFGEKILISNNKGTIYHLDENLKLLNNIKFGYFPINNMKLNGNEELLAVSSSDKKIGVFRTNNLDGEPLIIDNIDSQIRSFEFSKSNFLIVGLENGECRFWSTNVKNNILELCKISSRSLSNKEWDKYIGDKILYKKACKN